VIGQYLPQTNESVTVPKIQNFCQLNKALSSERTKLEWGVRVVYCTAGHGRDSRLACVYVYILYTQPARSFVQSLYPRRSITRRSVDLFTGSRGARKDPHVLDASIFMSGLASVPSIWESVDDSRADASDEDLARVPADGGRVPLADANTP